MTQVSDYNTWFTSDSHFGHKNILEYKDIMYHLSDFAFGRSNINIAGRLSGKKILIFGNHDTYPSTEYFSYFDKLYEVKFWKMCILSHAPVHPNNLKSIALLNVHGHLNSKKVIYQIDPYGDIHPNWKNEDKNYFNVSCEQNNLTPIHADLILERLKEVKNEKNNNNHTLNTNDKC